MTLRRPGSHLVTLAAALFGAVLISFSAIFFGLSEVSPITGAFFRVGYALPILFVLWLIRRHQDRRPLSRHWIAIGAGLALSADLLTWHTSIEFIGAGLATLIANTSVVFVALGAWLLFKEKPRRTTMVAIPVILFGVTLVSGLGQGDAFGSNPIRGTVLALMAAIFYASYLLSLRHSNQEQAPAAGPLMEATLGATLSLLILGLIQGGLDLEFSWPAHGWLLALAIGSQVIAWLMITYALPRLPAVETATIILIQPALTMIWGAIIFDERPSGLQIIGAVIIMVGVTVVAWVRARLAPAPLG